MRIFSSSRAGGAAAANSNAPNRRILTDRDRPTSNAAPAEQVAETSNPPKELRENKENFSRWRDRLYGARRWLESAMRDSSLDKDPGTFLYC